MRYITSLWILLALSVLPLKADNVFTEDLGLNTPIDTTSADSGDELEELDDIDVRASQLPECLAGLFSHDTLILGCDLDLLPQKIVVKTKDGDTYFKPIKVKITDGKQSVIYESIYVNDKYEQVETVRVYQEVLRHPQEALEEDMAKE